MIDERGRKLARDVLSRLRSTWAYAHDVEKAIQILDKVGSNQRANGDVASGV